jgi:hypothetical protein
VSAKARSGIGSYFAVFFGGVRLCRTGAHKKNSFHAKKPRREEWQSQTKTRPDLEKVVDLRRQPITNTAKSDSGQKESAAAVRISPLPASTSEPFAELPHIGNRALGHFLQTKLKVSQPGDKYEQEADRVADQITRMPGPIRERAAVSTLASSSRIQRACSHCEEEKGDQLHVQAKRSEGSARPSPSNDHAVHGFAGGGEPLSESTRAYFEPRFGYDFSDVRVHSDARAAESARAVGARAFTVGRNIVFNDGLYAPGTEGGRSLLAHELAHTVQQRAVGEPIIMRDEDPDSRFQLPSILPPFTLPGTGLLLQPGPLTQTLPGTRLPFPSSLRVTNALSVSGLGAPGIPSFVLDINPDLFMGTMLQRIDLTTSTLPGTPPGREGDPAYQTHISLLHPRVFFNPRTRSIDGRAILAVPTGYPAHIGAYTEVPVEFHSTDFGEIGGQVSYGPVHLDFSVRLHYDTARLEEAARPAFTPTGGFTGFWRRFQSILRATVPEARLQGIAGPLQSLLRSVMDGTIHGEDFANRTTELVAQSVPAGASTENLRTALSQLGNEITHPGFSASGSLRIGPVPISTFSIEAPTTVPLRLPLLGAPTAFPSTISAGGVVVAPPGAITDIAVPAFGYSRSSYGATSGTSITAALLPSLSPTAISGGQPAVRQFPIFAYAEVSHVRRVSAGFDIGVRATLQISTPDLAGPLAPPANELERWKQTYENYREATSREPARAPTPNLGVGLFGRF